MEVAFLLCDAAQVSPDNKLHVLGAGWRVCGPILAAHAVVALVSLETHEQGRDQELVLHLADEDGHVVNVTTPQGTMVVEARGTIRADPAPGLPVGQVIDVPFTASVGAGLPLPPGRTYVWQLWLNGETREDWRCSFFVRPAE